MDWEAFSSPNSMALQNDSAFYGQITISNELTTHRGDTNWKWGFPGSRKTRAESEMTPYSLCRALHLTRTLWLYTVQCREYGCHFGYRHNVDGDRSRWHPHRTFTQSQDLTITDRVYLWSIALGTRNNLSVSTMFALSVCVCVCVCVSCSLNTERFSLPPDSSCVRDGYVRTHTHTLHCVGYGYTHSSIKDVKYEQQQHNP